MQTETLILAFSVLLGVLMPEAQGGQGPSDPPPIVADENLQAQITRMAESRDEKDMNERLEPFRNVAPEKRTNLVLQVVLNASRRQGIGYFVPYFIVKAMGISEEDFLRIVAPYASSDDPSLRREIRERLSGADQPRQGGPPNFNCYLAIIRERTNDVPQGLVKYIYERSPDSALSTMAAVYLNANEAMALTDEAKAQDQRKALFVISNRPEWWAHLYVAETMKKNPQLRDPAILKKLEKDDNPLVREKVSEVLRSNKER